MGKTQQSRAFIFDKKITNLTSGIYSVTESDELLKCSTSTGTISIDLLPIGDKWDWEYKLYIIDSDGDPSWNNILINAPVGHLINGLSTVTISNNFGSALIRIVDSTNYIAEFSSSGSYQGIINIGYSDFYTLFSGGTLVPGATYRISDYNTSHWILEDPNEPFNTASIEPIYVFATSPSTIDKRVISEIYPEDLIYWDPDPNNFTLDEAFWNSLGSLVDNFKGVITYRKDMLNNIETYYDWRAFVFRRWSMDTVGIPTWDSSTSYSTGDIVEDPNDGCYYAAIQTAPSSINPPYDNGYFIKLVDGNNLYIFPQPYKHEFNLGTTPALISISVDSTSYQDFLTFNNFYNVQNVSIEKRGGFGQSLVEGGGVADTYLYTGNEIFNSSIPNIILVTDSVMVPAPIEGYNSLCSTINGFYSKGNSSLCNFYFRFDGNNGYNHKNIEINYCIGVLFNYDYDVTSGPQQKSVIENLRMDKLDCNLFNCSLIYNSHIKNSKYSVFNNRIKDSDFNYFLSTSIRSILGDPNASVASYFNNITFSNYLLTSDSSKFNYIDSSIFGRFSTNSDIISSEISNCSGLDFTASIIIYGYYDKKVMGTTGGAYLFYMDNTGTLQTDVATN